MLPMTILRRFDCVLAPTKAAVVKRYKQIKDGKVKNIDPILNKVAGNGDKFGFHNHSNLDFPRLKGDPDNIGRHLTDYIAGFSANVRKIFEYFEFEKEIEKLEEANRLYLVVSKFAEIDLHPKRVGNITMGLIFEDLIRRFNEAKGDKKRIHDCEKGPMKKMRKALVARSDLPKGHRLMFGDLQVRVAEGLPPYQDAYFEGRRLTKEIKRHESFAWSHVRPDWQNDSDDRGEGTLRLVVDGLPKR